MWTAVFLADGLKNKVHCILLHILAPLFYRLMKSCDYIEQFVKLYDY